MCTTNNVIGCKCNATVLDGVHEQKWCFFASEKKQRKQSHVRKIRANKFTCRGMDPTSDGANFVFGTTT